MHPDTFALNIVNPALSFLTSIDGILYNTLLARKLLIAIAWQESRLEHREQIRGPARGFWQFEKAGVQGVLNHAQSKRQILKVLDVLEIAEGDVMTAIRFNDVLACCFARLLLWTDPSKLPDNRYDAWDYYIRNWRPGKPHRETWDSAWRLACDAA